MVSPVNKNHAIAELTAAISDLQEKINRQNAISAVQMKRCHEQINSSSSGDEKVEDDMYQAQIQINDRLTALSKKLEIALIEIQKIKSTK